MTTRSNTLEGTNGNTITTSNTGGTNQFTGVTIDPGAALIFSNTQVYAGSTSAKYTLPNATAAQCTLAWSGITATSNAYVRIYLYATAQPNVNTRLISWVGSGSNRIGVQWLSTGKLRLLNSSGTAVATGSVNVPLNQWVRVEFDATGLSGTTGNGAIRFYSGAQLEGSTPDETISATGLTTGGNTVDDVRFGTSGTSVTMSPAWDLYIDQIDYSDVAQPGPANPAVTGTLATTLGNATLAATGTVSAAMPEGVSVWLDDGTGAFPYDITSKAQFVPGYTITKGRQDEMSDVTPGTCSLVLDNTDGRFTLGSTVIASPSPVVVDNKVCVKATVNGNTYFRFTGYIQGLPVEWPSGGDTLSRVTVTAVDAQARAERRTLRSVVEEEIMLDSPFEYFTLGEPEGSTAVADSSGSQASSLAMTGTGTDVVFGNATGLPTDGLTAATFANGKYLTDGALQVLTNSGGVIAFNTTMSGSVAALVGDPTSTPIIGLDATGHLTCFGAVTTAGTVNDGSWHVAAWSKTGTSVTLYVDGVNAGSGTTFASFTTVRHLGAGYTGSLAHFARFLTGTSSTRAAAYSTAGSTGFAGEYAGDRYTRLCSYGNLPTPSVPTSITQTPALTGLSGTRLADIMRDTVDAEMGLAYIGGGGSPLFFGRSAVASKVVPDLTYDANAVDAGTRIEVDLQGVVNYLEATSAETGLKQVARDTRSELGNGTVTYPGHGRYDRSTTYAVRTDAEALDRANWLVGNHSEPKHRIGALAVDLLGMTAAFQEFWTQILPNSWIRITGMPSQTPGGTTVDLVVQGFTETRNASQWSITFNVTARSMYQGWVLDNTTYSVLDSTTRLYV